MDKIEKIRQEIERRKNICEGVFERESDTYYQGKAVAYGELLTFLSTLESEEPDKSLEEKLNEEIKRFVAKYGYERSEDILLIAIVARHFAKWGADHTPLPEDTVIFNKGVAEGKRLMLEDAVEGFVAAHLTSEGTKITVNSGYLPKEMCIKPGEKVRIIVCKKED